jgi:hypothetical protein
VVLLLCFTLLATVGSLNRFLGASRGDVLSSAAAAASPAAAAAFFLFLASFISRSCSRALAAFQFAKSITF